MNKSRCWKEILRGSTQPCGLPEPPQRGVGGGEKEGTPPLQIQWEGVKQRDVCPKFRCRITSVERIIPHSTMDREPGG